MMVTETVVLRWEPSQIASSLLLCTTKFFLDMMLLGEAKRPRTRRPERLFGRREAKVDVDAPLAVTECDYLRLFLRPNAGIVDARLPVCAVDRSQ